MKINQLFLWLIIAITFIIMMVNLILSLEMLGRLGYMEALIFNNKILSQ